MKKLITILFAVALGPASWGQSECGELLDSNQDGYIGVEDLMNLLSYFGDADVDLDGIWDSQDECVGEYDECGVCNGEGAQFQVIDSIIVNYDSVYVDLLEEWLVFVLSADTIFDFQCSTDGDDSEPAEFACGNPFNYENFSYETIIIGDQCWFAENLRTEIYLNGDPIDYKEENSDWSSSLYGAYCFPMNDSSLIDNFGYLYNWWTVFDFRMLCPSGWHVPNNGDWHQLKTWLGEDPGLAMKASASDSLPWNGTNNSGFTAVPAGSRSQSGGFGAPGWSATFWSTSPYSSGAERWSLSSNLNSLNNSWTTALADGYSIRCLKDTEE